MLTGFTWCIPLKTKTAAEVVTAYKNHIYCNFGRSVEILMDNGTEFKNKLKKVIEELGNEMSIHSPPTVHTTKQQENRADSTDSSKPTSQSTSTMDWNGMN